MRRGNHFDLLGAYEKLVCNKLRAISQVKVVLAKAAADPSFWSGGNRRLNKRVVLERLGFPKEMSTASVALYWRKLVEGGIIISLWEYRLFVVLKFCLSFDATSWLGFHRLAQNRASYEREANRINSLLKEKGLPIRVTHQAIRTLIRVLDEDKSME